MNAVQRVSHLFHQHRSPRDTGPGTAYQTRRVIPGPFMMGWVVDVPRGSARNASAGGRDE